MAYPRKELGIAARWTVRSGAVCLRSGVGSALGVDRVAHLVPRFFGQGLPVIATLYLN